MLIDTSFLGYILFLDSLMDLLFGYFAMICVGSGYSDDHYLFICFYNIMLNHLMIILFDYPLHIYIYLCITVLSCLGFLPNFGLYIWYVGHDIHFRRGGWLLGLYAHCAY